MSIMSNEIYNFLIITGCENDAEGLRVFVARNDVRSDQRLRPAVLADDRVTLARLLHQVVLQMTGLGPQNKPPEINGKHKPT